MSSSSRLRCFLFEGLLLFGIAGCDSADDPAGSSGLAGMYQTTAHSESRPCDAAGTELPLVPPYFRVVDDEFSPSTVIDVYACDDADPSSCDESPLVFLAESIGNDTFFTHQTTRTGDDPCFVTWTGSDVRKTEDGADIATERHSGEWTGRDCVDDITDGDVDRARAFPCDELETLSGAKL